MWFFIKNEHRLSSKIPILKFSWINRLTFNLKLISLLLYQKQKKNNNSIQVQALNKVDYYQSNESDLRFNQMQLNSAQSQDNHNFGRNLSSPINLINFNMALLSLCSVDCGGVSICIRPMSDNYHMFSLNSLLSDGFINFSTS